MRPTIAGKGHVRCPVCQPAQLARVEVGMVAKAVGEVTHVAQRPDESWVIYASVPKSSTAGDGGGQVDTSHQVAVDVLAAAPGVRTAEPGKLVVVVVGVVPLELTAWLFCVGSPARTPLALCAHTKYDK